jgi:metallo-beta-lactamase family protein
MKLVSRRCRNCPGSKYLLELAGTRLLIDCGLFQGLKRLRERNWKPLPFDPKSLDAIVLTHAHLDHSGYLPLVARAGFRGPVYCTAATEKLLGLLLPDSAHLQEEEARFANRHRFSKHAPALPLYRRTTPQRRCDCSGRSAGRNRGHPRRRHALLTGRPPDRAASVLVEAGSKRVLFSGDVGRPDDPLMRPPEPPPHADWTVIESTYGDRVHAPVDPEAELASAINRAVERGGMVVVPAFAVGRTQLLLLLTARLKARRAIPDVPVFLNSPMATDATRIYREHRPEHRLSEEECRVMCSTAQYVNTVEESKALNELREPAVIIAASGMAAGGRVVHHLKAYAGMRAT